MFAAIKWPADRRCCFVDIGGRGRNWPGACDQGWGLHDPFLNSGGVFNGWRCGKTRRAYAWRMNGKQKTWHAAHKESLSTGERAADVMRNSMGSWRFVAGFIVFMLLWAALNSWILAARAWDPYPYILLNLFLSMLAGLQGAILLIAAKRQDAIAAAMAQHDYDTDVQAKKELERLTTINREQLEILRELRSLAASQSSRG
jgi:uncharacterized membrane protein